MSLDGVGRRARHVLQSGVLRFKDSELIGPCWRRTPHRSGIGTHGRSMALEPSRYPTAAPGNGLAVGCTKLTDLYRRSTRS